MSYFADSRRSDIRSSDELVRSPMTTQEAPEAGEIGGPEQYMRKIIFWSLVANAAILNLSYICSDFGIDTLLEVLEKLRALAELWWNNIHRTQIQLELLTAVAVLLQWLQFLLSRLRCRTTHWFVHGGAWVAYYAPVPLATYAAGMMQRLSYPYILVALFFSSSLTNTMTAYTLRDGNKQSMRCFGLLVLSCFCLARFVLSFLATIIYRSSPDWHLELLSATTGIAAFAIDIKVQSMAIPGPDRSKMVADHMKSETNFYTDYYDYDPECWKGYKYIVTTGSLASYEQAITSATTLDDINIQRLPSSRLKDVCLASALFHLLLRHYYKLECTEVHLNKTRDLVFKGLLPDHRRLFRVVEIQLSFLHDYFFAAHLSLSTTHHLLLMAHSILKLFFFLSVLCLIRSTASAESDMEIIDGTIARSISMTSLGALVLLELFYLVSYFASNWYAVSYICNAAENNLSWHRNVLIAENNLSWHRNVLSKWCVTCLNNMSLLGSSFWQNKLGQYSVIEEVLNYKSRKLQLKDILGATQGRIRGTPVPLSDETTTKIADILRSYSGNVSNGQLSLHRNEVFHQLSWACRQETEVHSILTWHVATCFCETYYQDRERISYKVATQLSKYCAYLVAFRPELMSTTNQDAEAVIGTLSQEISSNMKGVKSMVDMNKQISNWLMEGKAPVEPKEAGTSNQELGEGIFWRSVTLGRQLLQVQSDRRWNVLADYWAEMLLSLAPSKNVAGHIEHLADGGEFITHLWALLANAGILEWQCGSEALDRILKKSTAAIPERESDTMDQSWRRIMENKDSKQRHQRPETETETEALEQASKETSLRIRYRQGKKQQR